MSIIKKVWNGFVAIIMFFYLVLVLLLGKIIGLAHLHKGYWAWLRKVICQNGPIWVKISQWISNRPDLCNPVIAEELSALREHCPTHSWNVSKEIFKKETNTDITHFLDHVETKPFASGSIGQVYKGVLDLNKLSSFKNEDTTSNSSNNEEKVDVVIKIQHPDLDIKMKWFFVFVKWWNKFFGFIRLTKFQIPISTEDMEAHLLSQLDYKQEATNMELARKNFADNPHVIIPKVYYKSRNVLITREESGIHYLDFKKKYPDNNRELRFVDTIIKLSIMQMALINVMTHADLHDGNWAMRMPTSEMENLPNYSKGFPQIVIYDWGLVTTTGDLEMNRSFFHQLRLGDFSKILDLVESHISYVSKWEKEKFDSFKNVAMEKFREEKEKKSNLKLKDKLEIILSVIRTYNFVLQPSLISLITTIMLLQEQMVNKRDVNKGEEDLDYLASVSVQLAFCRGTKLFREYGDYLVVVNEKLKSFGQDKLFVEGDLFLKKYDIGGDDVTDIDSDSDWCDSDIEDADSLGEDEEGDGEEDEGDDEDGEGGEGDGEGGEGGEGGYGGDSNQAVTITIDNVDPSENNIKIEDFSINNDMYQKKFSNQQDMMNEIRSELLHHFPHQNSDQENNLNN